MLSFTEMRARFLKLDTPHICDGAREKIKLFPPLTCYSTQPKMFGTAHTVASEGHLLAVIRGLREAKSDEVLVVSSGESSSAQLGEIFATYAQHKKLAGVIVDGACRDVDAIHKLSIPFYAKNIYPVAGGTTKEGKTQIPLQISGVDLEKITITPGDLIVSDINSILAFSVDDAEEVLQAAERVQQKEQTVLAKIKEGHSLPKLLAMLK